MLGNILMNLISVRTHTHTRTYTYVVMELCINVTPAVLTKTHQESIFTNKVIREAYTLLVYLWYILGVLNLADAATLLAILVRES